MGRSTSCCKKEDLKKGPWTAEEDKILTAYIQEHGHGSWRALPEKAGLKRCGKSCRLRWINYLRPDIKRGKFSLQEEQIIIQLHALLGNRWSAMAAHLPKRTDNEIKNHWNTHLKKRLIKMGIDPMTHKPRTDNASRFPSGPGGKNASNLSHMAQWESARLEAEARLVRESSKQVAPNPLILPKNQTINNVAAAAAASGRPRCLDVLKAWQGVVAGMFVFPSQDLGSPTSTLNFPDVTATRAAPVDELSGYVDNSWKCVEKTNDYPIQEVGERMIFDSCIKLQDDLTMDCVDAGEWFEDSFRVGNENVPIASIMEGLSDALNFDSGVLMSSSMGVERSTESCWDSVLNVVNSSPYASPSPVF